MKDAIIQYFHDAKTVIYSKKNYKNRNQSENQQTIDNPSDIAIRRLPI